MEDKDLVIDRLKTIIKDIYWMAYRYADGRNTYAPYLYNTAMVEAIKMGIDLKDVINGKLVAKDGMIESMYDNFISEINSLNNN